MFCVYKQARSEAPALLARPRVCLQVLCDLLDEDNANLQVDAMALITSDCGSMCSLSIKWP